MVFICTLFSLFSFSLIFKFPLLYSFRWETTLPKKWNFLFFLIIWSKGSLILFSKTSVLAKIIRVNTIFFLIRTAKTNFRIILSWQYKISLGSRHWQNSFNVASFRYLFVSIYVSFSKIFWLINFACRMRSLTTNFGC